MLPQLPMEQDARLPFLPHQDYFAVYTRRQMGVKGVHDTGQVTTSILPNKHDTLRVLKAAFDCSPAASMVQIGPKSFGSHLAVC